MSETVTKATVPTQTTIEQLVDRVRRIRDSEELARLVRHENNAVRFAAVSNPIIKSSTLRFVTKNEIDPDIKELAKAIKRSRSLNTWLKVLGIGILPSEAAITLLSNMTGALPVSLDIFVFIFVITPSVWLDIWLLHNTPVARSETTREKQLAQLKDQQQKVEDMQRKVAWLTSSDGINCMIDELARFDRKEWETHELLRLKGIVAQMDREYIESTLNTWNTTRQYEDQVFQSGAEKEGNLKAKLDAHDAHSRLARREAQWKATPDGMLWEKLTGSSGKFGSGKPLGLLFATTRIESRVGGIQRDERLLPAIEAYMTLPFNERLRLVGQENDQKLWRLWHYEHAQWSEEVRLEAKRRVEEERERVRANTKESAKRASEETKRRQELRKAEALEMGGY